MIGSILDGKKPVVSVTPETPVRTIAQLLHDHRIGAVLVMAADSIVGLVSERDICRCLHTHGGAILDEQARDIMTTPVITASLRTSLAEAMEIMTDRRFRHLPVMDGSTLIGIVSIGDLVKRRIEQAEAEAEAMKQYIAS